MDLFATIRKRKSSRNFSDEWLSEKESKILCEIGYKIPSAGGLNPIEIYIAQFDKPPFYFVICADYDKTCKKYGERGKRYIDMEAGHTAQNLCLAAVALGLGSCCIGAFDEDEVQKRFKLKYKPVYMVAIGKVKI